MKKLLIITDNPYKLGGLERVTIDFANMMSKTYQVSIVCTDKKVDVDYSLYNLSKDVETIIDKSIQKEFSPNVLIRGLRFINKRYLGISNIGFLKRIYVNYCSYSNLINTINTNKYDVVVAMQLKLSIVLGYISDSVRSKTIGWQHNTYDAYFNMKKKYYWNQHQLASEYLKKLTRCIVLSDEDARLYKKNLNVEAKRIYNPITIGYKEFVTKPEVGTKRILWVGRITKVQKGIDYLIDIAETLKKIYVDFNLTIVGDGEDFLYLKQEISRRGLIENVVCVGRTNEVEKFYRESSVLISTSRWEGFGLTIVEAMAFGLPVIAFDNSGPDEIINSNDVGIIIPKYDIALFANRVNELLHDDKQLARMSVAAWTRAQDFTPNVISEYWKEEIDGKDFVSNNNC